MISPWLQQTLPSHFASILAHRRFYALGVRNVWSSTTHLDHIPGICYASMCELITAGHDLIELSGWIPVLRAYDLVNVHARFRTGSVHRKFTFYSCPPLEGESCFRSLDNSILSNSLFAATEVLTIPYPILVSQPRSPLLYSTTVHRICIVSILLQRKRRRIWLFIVRGSRPLCQPAASRRSRSWVLHSHFRPHLARLIFSTQSPTFVSATRTNAGVEVDITLAIRRLHPEGT